MINKKTSIYDLINPCKISETHRVQAFVESESSSYQGGSGEIRITLPATECIDLTESYIDCLVTLNNTTPAVDTVYTLDLTGAVGGSYRFIYMTKASAILDIAATGAEIEAALNAMPTIGGLGYSVAVDPQGAGPIFTITINDTLNIDPFADREALVFEQASPIATISSAPLIQTVAGVLAYPRMDFLNPIIRQARLDINGANFVTVTDANVLSNMLMLCRPIQRRYGDYLMNEQNINGFFSENQFRIKINLDWVDFLKKILPLNIMNKQIKIYLQLEQNNRALVQETALSNGTYTVFSPRLHYHRITLTPDEEAAVTNAFNNEGIIIPFQNWTPFTDDISTSGNKTVLFNPGVSNLLAVFFVMSPNDYAFDPTSHQKTSLWLRNRIASYRLKLGSHYFPLDQIDSVNPGRHDMVEIITELEHSLANIYHVNESTYDRQIYFNFTGGVDGNDTDNVYFIWEFDEERRPSFVGGISTADTPHNQYGYICRSDALSGQNVSKLSNVSLELGQLDLGGNPNTLYVFALHQDFLHLTPTSETWYK